MTDRPVGQRGARALVATAAAWARDYAWAGRMQALGPARRTPPVLEGIETGPRVLLVPGVWEPWSMLLPLARRLQRAGCTVRFVPELGLHGQSLESSAALVRAAIDRGGDDVVLVAHSKGGLVSKLLLDAQRPGAGPRILGVVAIATPFAGSTRARLLRQRAIRELRVDAPGIVALAAERTANDRIVAVLPAVDPHIPGNRALEGMREVRLRATGHFKILDAPETAARVIEAVRALAA